MRNILDAVLIHKNSAGRQGIKPPATASAGRFFRTIGLAGWWLLLIPVIMAPAALPSAPVQDQSEKAKDSPSKLPSKLTAEEMEIINNRELLENLPLLQNFDKIEFIELLSEEDPDWAEDTEPEDPESKKEEGQKQ